MFVCAHVTLSWWIFCINIFRIVCIEIFRITQDKCKCNLFYGKCYFMKNTAYIISASMVRRSCAFKLTVRNAKQGQQNSIIPPLFPQYRMFSSFKGFLIRSFIQYILYTHLFLFSPRRLLHSLIKFSLRKHHLWHTKKDKIMVADCGKRNISVLLTAKL